MEIELIAMILYTLSFILTMSNRYGLIVLGMIAGLFLSGIMYNDIALFHETFFITISSVFYLGGGLLNAFEKWSTT